MTVSRQEEWAVLLQGLRIRKPVSLDVGVIRKQSPYKKWYVIGAIDEC